MFVASRDAAWLELVFRPFSPFVLHPGRIAMVAALLLLAYLALHWTGRFRAWPMAVAAIVWGLWAPWEWYANAMKWDIRVDLLLVCPFLVVVTAWAVVASFWLKSWK
jgi:hypothetical protein